jgi:hypothetical protein
MSSLPPPFDRSEDSDEQYRRASEHDPSRPSEATRRAVLEHAARLAAERARRDARRRWWRGLLAPNWQPAIVGTLAAVVLVGVVVAPQFLAPTVPPASQPAPAALPPQAAVAPASVPAVRPAPEERRPAPGTVESASRERLAPTREPARALARADQATLAKAARTEAGAAPVPASSPAAGDLSASPSTAVTVTAQRGYTSSVRAAAPVASASQDAPLQEVVVAPAPVSGADALRQAAAAGDVPALRTQLASAGDIDARDAQGRTALMLATLNGQADAVAVLLAHGADPSAADARGTTPLQAAIAAEERGIIALLRRYGAR